MPGQESQEELLREACRVAGVAPADIRYVEAHGTGTPVGDPIEARALGRVLGEGRPADRPCRVHPWSRSGHARETCSHGLPSTVQRPR